MIVHEIGHAVSLEKWRQAVIANDKKTLDQIGGWNANDARPIQALQKWIADKEYVTDYAASLAIPADHPQDAKLPTVISNKAKAPAELFAEVYSLWRTNPAYLQEHHAELWKWFENDANRQRGKCD